MAAITLKAHFDGNSIKLDEPYPLPMDAQLLVTVLTPIDANQERTEWFELSMQGLARAYGDDEPDYSAAEILP
jgi:hypothetical protein